MASLKRTTLYIRIYEYTLARAATVNFDEEERDLKVRRCPARINTTDVYHATVQLEAVVFIALIKHPL